ncbi:hypothetical protein GFS24_25060 [Chitinophaga sp. SYP-B3965]|uniref:hypothetical protein n=1 Tax=Chitinophaga sp. SYP-B3965 TaxID=2663120 RepID=UPI00129998EF|nr:hypothetical protein [Chitinophaga sp. SYP-B3965]MRG48409.1 hypothetical protein [Chitinophaga sp. SYP-B3965]
MAKAVNTKKITHAVVRMYCMGTGDCFIIKFFAGKKECFKMMIDCGVWSGKKEHLTTYIEDLKSYVDNSIDLLVVTHEHADHVSVFETCQELFTKNFKVKQTWMGWSEDDRLSKIKKWKTEHGEKKKALAMAAERLEKTVNEEEEKGVTKPGLNNKQIMGARKHFSLSLKSFSDLHVQGVAGNYKGALEGMRIVKKEIAKDKIEYLYPGNIIEDLPGLEGVKFYVLGPPEKWGEVEEEGGGEGESYTHNKELKGGDAFAAAILSDSAGTDTESILPFEEFYETKISSAIDLYKEEENAWRNIDNEWLFSAGSLALRINSLTNNLSLALAIEFEDSKRVMLFPGDAEYGSWCSWHKINWEGTATVEDGKHFTQDLLRRTVFYKVAHHMSHNGTAKRLGLNMMENKDLAAMATLDYGVIAPGWDSTMPNREMLSELLRKTKGKVMIMNDNDLFFDFHGQEPLPAKIEEARKKMSTKEMAAFNKAYNRAPGNLYVEYTVKA